MILEGIDKKLLKIYEKQKKNYKDKTGWYFIQELKKEAKYNSFLFSFLVYRTFQLAFERKKEIINLSHMIRELLRSYYQDESFNPYKRHSSDNKVEIEILKGIVFNKGITTIILEHLYLEQTKRAFLFHLMIKEKEINENNFLSENEIRKFIDIEEVIDIFMDEYNKKLKDKPRIIEVKNII